MVEDDIQDLTEDVLGIQTKFEEDVQTLAQIFPDCDDDYILSLLLQNTDDPNRVVVVTNMLVDKSYPKRKKEDETDSFKGKNKNGLNMSEIVKKNFYDTGTMVSASYMNEWYEHYPYNHTLYVLDVY